MGSRTGAIGKIAGTDAHQCQWQKELPGAKAFHAASEITQENFKPGSKGQRYLRPLNNVSNPVMKPANTTLPTPLTTKLLDGGRGARAYVTILSFTRVPALQRARHHRYGDRDRINAN